MVFSSLIFLFHFLPAALFIYFVSPKKLKNTILFAMSLIFYAWGEPVYIILMIFSTIFDYVNGLLVVKYRHHKWLARAIFIASICGNVAILGFFKYVGFLVQTINECFGMQMQVPDLPLPIGISFYTFQTMSYVADVYLGKVSPQCNMIAFGTYVAMFPQLVAGPIVKYGDIASQLVSRTISLEKFGEGTLLFIRGLAKKVLLANNIGMLWSSVKSTPLEELTVLSAWLGILAFTLQIYFDFSGYSDMARGLGKMFGFDLPINFRHPYISTSVTEFWRRWHITLGFWFREYVYIPLGGNRHGLRKQLRNLFVVWFLTGLWHGASWNFIIWGLYFGFIITMEKLFLLEQMARWPRWISRPYTLMIVIVGWVLFEYEHMSSGLAFIAAMFGFGGHDWMDTQALYNLRTYGGLFILLIICATPFARKLIELAEARWKHTSVIVAACYMVGLVLATSYLVDESYNPFLYFRF
ncbi:MBOAT family protein [Paenibacillus sp. ClWae2A]|uniref:MBOAT family O-acyltransferase n=1 Tax=Paenibacillus sp. ClWae2A TaxID=3057177 RepID=UPI0028F60E6B|nr:MBOAT family protein [Paenibacillus sp. ClWae2A]MDT9717883.1 MBOAT family protein [Paenibacillus sp. ClWae2A]